VRYTRYPTHIQRDDGLAIPIDENNYEYRAYLAWLAAGNTPSNPPAPSPDQLRERSITLYNKLAERVSVKDYGAVGDGVANDTVAINVAISANPGKRIYFPAGAYKVTSTILLTGDGARIQGDGWGTQIFSTALNVPVISIVSPFCAIDGVALSYAGTPVAGASTINVASSAASLTNFVVRNGYVGLNVTASGVALVVSDFDILDYENAGVLLTDVNDVFLSDFILNAGNLSRGTQGGIRLVGNVQALVAQNGDVLFGVYGMTTDSTTNTYNARPSYNKFANVYFDSTKNGVSLNKTVSTTFESCWFASTKAYFGIEITSCDCITFQKCEIVNNWQHGAVINASSFRTIFESCKVLSNGQQTPGAYHGLVFQSGTSDFRVQGNIVGNHIGFNTRQQFGILINSGASDRYIIADNLVSNNLSSGVSDGGTGVNKRVASNF